MGLNYHTISKKHGLIKIDLYRKDEPRGSAENKDDEQIYLSKSQINYPLFNVKLSGSKAAGLDLEPNSDYEVIFCYLLTYFGIIYFKKILVYFRLWIQTWLVGGKTKYVNLKSEGPWDPYPQMWMFPQGKLCLLFFDSLIRFLEL